LADINEDELDDFEVFDDDDIDEHDDILEDPQKDSTKDQNSTSSKILLTILSIITITILTIFIIILISDDQSVDELPIEEINTSEIVKNIRKPVESLSNNSRLDRLTSQAKDLYDSGKKGDALKIYKDIATFHNSLSKFNLGVANFKNQAYEKAIGNFEESFKLDELKFESAINLALCYKNLNNNKKFSTYLTIAKEHLLLKLNTPLFGYYLGLIYYYQDMPLNALETFKKYDSIYYKKNRYKVLSKLYAYIGNYQESINYLTKKNSYNNSYIVALNYAKLGEFRLSAKYLNEAINLNPNRVKPYAALALVQIKMGLYKDSASTLKYLNDNHTEQAPHIFPITLQIKESLYDPVLAQKEFKNTLFNNMLNRFALIFYFAPYKIFDTKQSNTIIQKGAKEIYIDNIPTAFSYLNQGEAISNINSKIVDALKLISEHKIYEANSIFKNLIKQYPNHSILHYNLALTYANIYDFQKAYKHFSKSYILDKQNYMAAFFKAYSAMILNQDIDQKEIKLQIQNVTNQNKKQIYLLHKILTPKDSSIDIDYKDKDSIFDTILNIIAANQTKNLIAYKKLSSILKEHLPSDIVANIIYIDQHNQKRSIQEYAANIQQTLFNNSLDISPLLYGESLARELYIKTLSIAGITRTAKLRLENEYKQYKEQPALLQSLAYTYIYTKEYAKAYKIYNDLIDIHKQQDPHTLFLAAIAAIGAKHYANAIALLELTNLQNRNFYESRFALGLLYQEAKNLQGASIQLSKIGNNGFKSKYFKLKLKK
jgi:tetratricopeptide (TPR) repeat protein